MKTKQKINHSGNVIIGKNSSIGSNTTIDRAVFDSTIVGEFSNIDNLGEVEYSNEKITDSEDLYRKHNIRKLASDVGVPELSCTKRKKALQYGTKIHKSLLKTR